MIIRYALNGFSRNALDMSKKMQISRVNLNSITFSNVLLLYATMEALEEDTQIYQGVVENSFSSNFVVVSALIDMYAKYQRI